MMKVVGFAAIGRDSVYIDTDKLGLPILDEFNAGLFLNFASRRGTDRLVGDLHVPAGKKPAIEPPVVYSQNTNRIHGEYHSGARDVSRCKVCSSERITCRSQQHPHQLAAL